MSIGNHRPVHHVTHLFYDGITLISNPNSTWDDYKKVMRSNFILVTRSFVFFCFYFFFFVALLDGGKLILKGGEVRWGKELEQLNGARPPRRD